MLHAFELGLVHPFTNEELHFSAPIPRDFADVLERCS
jgi:23S rRNA-/tRNA-specific pseudouridylate synthase